MQRVSVDAPPQATAVKYVFIPCDDTLDLQELVLQPEGVETVIPSDKLKTHLVRAFRGGAIDSDAVEKQLGGFGPVDTSIFREGTVESFPLTRASPSNGSMGVNYFIDECGVLKNLPRNARASALAAKCGHTSSFHGDVYVAREKVVQGEGNRMVDFGLQDMSSDSVWMATAMRENFEHSVAAQKMRDEMGSRLDQVNLREGLEEGNLAHGDEEGYSWTQTAEEVDIRVPVADGTTTKDVRVTFGVRALTVALGHGKPSISLQLSASIRPDESTWTLQGSGSGRELNVHMEKLEQLPWRQLTKTSPASDPAP